MSAKREPLLSDDALLELTYVKEDGRRPSEQVRDFYEAALAKDAEVVAFILKKWKEELEADGWETSENHEAALEAAGFKPSEQ